MTKGHTLLLGLGSLRKWLDLMIVKVFSNLNYDSLVL